MTLRVGEHAMSEPNPHSVIFDAAPSLEPLKQLPADEKSFVLLARLSRIGARAAAR